MHPIKVVALAGLVFLVVIGMGWFVKPQLFILPNDNLNKATLNALYEALPGNEQYNSISVDFGEADKAALDAEQAKIAKLRQWVETIKDVSIRNSYVHWLDFFQRQLDDAYKEIPIHAQQIELNKTIPRPPL